ncbi:MAG TPA: amino acid ABC transporter substrate-binding protein [Longimicrobiales bacterium]|nr:amino acid ABC transporter substrate-binding protein [Longimicrobiales bacterium]
MTFRRNFAIVALVGLAACGSDPMEQQPTETLRIGAALSLTGAQAFEGTEVRAGYDLWAHWANEELEGIQIGSRRYEVEIIYYDDQSNPALTADLTEKLILDDEVDFLLGPYGSDPTLTAAAVADTYGVVMVQAGGASESIFEQGFQNVFGILTPARQYTRSAIERLAQLGAQTAVIAHEQGGAFSTSVAEGAIDWADEFGIDVLAVQTYTRGASDLSGIVQAAQALDPDVFIAGGYFNDAVLFRRTAAQLGFDPPAMLLTVGPSSPQFVAALGDTANLVLGPSQWEASMTWEDAYFGTAAQFAQRFEAATGRAPTYQAAQAAAAGLTLMAALQAAGSIETNAVRTALRALDITTFFGPIRFDATGKNVSKPMGVTQVQNGEIVVVAPAGIAVADLIYND